jgi:hypothetical protein
MEVSGLRISRLRVSESDTAEDQETQIPQESPRAPQPRAVREPADGPESAGVAKIDESDAPSAPGSDPEAPAASEEK